MNGDVLNALEALRQGAGGLVSLLGFFLIFSGLLGLMRFPDFYTRLHAAATATGIGAGVAVLGLAIAAASFGAAVKLVVLALLLGALSPVLSYLGANAAHAGGLTPIAGAYLAPRPGRKSASDETRGGGR